MNTLEKMLLGGANALEFLNIRQDDATPSQRIIEWNGFKIGLQYLPFQLRHGRLLTAAYGHFQKTKGADNMALDVYVGTKLESPKIYAIAQFINGAFDEEKLIIGVDTEEEARNIYLGAMPKEMFGGIRELSLDQLNEYRTDAVEFTDKELHDLVVSAAKKKFSPFPSRYAGYWISQEYKRRYKEKHNRSGGIRSDEDVRRDFAAGLLSRADALEMLGYDGAKHLAERADSELAINLAPTLPNQSSISTPYFWSGGELPEAPGKIFAINHENGGVLAVGYNSLEQAELAFESEFDITIENSADVTDLLDQRADEFNLDAKNKVVRGNLCRDARGRFTSCGQPVTKVESSLAKKRKENKEAQLTGKLTQEKVKSKEIEALVSKIKPLNKDGISPLHKEEIVKAAGESGYKKYAKVSKAFVEDTGNKGGQEYRQAVAELVGRNVKDEYLGTNKSLFKKNADKDLLEAVKADMAIQQEYARANFGESFPVYRGVGAYAMRQILQQYPNLKEGDEIEIPVNALSSWTKDKNFAEGYAKNEYGTQGLIKPGLQSAVVSTTISHKQVGFVSDLHSNHKSVYKDESGKEIAIASKETTIKVKIENLAAINKYNKSVQMFYDSSYFDNKGNIVKWDLE